MDTGQLAAPASPTDAERLGKRIRAVRLTRGMTLVQLAAAAELSHPFLSQLERGLARPSMLSLDKIARALGSSHLELISGAADRVRTPVTSSPRLLRSDEGETGPFGEGESRLLAYGERAFHPMRFEGTNTSGGEYHAHDEDEFLHVIEGSCTVELREHGRFELALGDSLYFDGGTPHRWFSRDGSRYRLFIVKQHFAMRDLDSVWGPALLVDYEESE